MHQLLDLLWLLPYRYPFEESERDGIRLYPNPIWDEEQEKLELDMAVFTEQLSAFDDDFVGDGDGDFGDGRERETDEEISFNFGGK